MAALGSLAKTLRGVEVAEVSEGSSCSSAQGAAPTERKGALTASGNISFWQRALISKIL